MSGYQTARTARNPSSLGPGAGTGGAGGLSGGTISQSNSTGRRTSPHPEQRPARPGRQVSRVPARPPGLADRISSPLRHNRVGRYQIIRTLGQGSFGKVKLAYHPATSQEVALKILDRGSLAMNDQHGRVHREISFLRLLRHPHIIELYDVVKSRDEIIMVIEFAGIELYDYILQNGHLQEHEARRFLQQIMSALEHCHKHKIVHRDLKPENLLLDKNHNIKIADFGLSNIMTDGNFLKTSCGSPNYAAPEVISGRLYAGPEVDVWSTGVTLYAMLCGKLPFHHDDLPTLYRIIFNGQFQIPNVISPAAANLIGKMLIVDPVSRATVQDVMRDEWYCEGGVPEYLQSFADEEPLDPDDPVVANESIVKELCRTMGYSKEQIYDAFSARGQGESQIFNAYAILEDSRRYEEQRRRGRSTVSSEEAIDPLDTRDYRKELQRFDSPSRSRSPTGSPTGSPDGSIRSGSPFSRFHGFSGSPTAGFEQPMTNDDLEILASEMPENSLKILLTSIPTYHRASVADITDDLDIKRVKSAKSRGTSKTPTNWHFGIRSHSYPLDVMNEIYGALYRLGAEWAQPSLQDMWTIHVRWNVKEAERQLDRQVPCECLKLDIQLYQTLPDHYLLDFKFDGWESPHGKVWKSSAYPFLHFIRRLIVELSVGE